jgi:hypothetical protein
MGGAGLTVRAPSDAGLATPGYYMLFVLDETGTPSVARWLRLGVEPPATEPPAPSPPAPSPPAPNPPARDRKAPKIKVSLKRPRLRITLSEPGKATVEIRAGKRRIRRTLTFRKGALTRTLKLPRLKGTVRVVVRAVDASGNRSTSRKSYRSSRKVKRA